MYGIEKEFLTTPEHVTCFVYFHVILLTCMKEIQPQRKNLIRYHRLHDNMFQLRFKQSKTKWIANVTNISKYM